MGVHQGLPFVFHDAMKSIARGDYATVYEKLKDLCCYACRISKFSDGEPSFDMKRGFRFLDTAERRTIQDAFSTPSATRVSAAADVVVERIRTVAGGEFGDQAIELHKILDSMGRAQQIR